MSRSTPTLGEKVPIDMTPMIDIVFQLLTFFIMTLQIAAQEGDFIVRMPLSTGVPHEPSSETVPTVRLRLHATKTGDLAEVRLNDVSYGSGTAAWKGIQNQIVQLLGDGTLQDALEVELDCDERLKYENVIAAITAVSGQSTVDGEHVKLVERIKFAAPRPVAIE